MQRKENCRRFPILSFLSQSFVSQMQQTLHHSSSITKIKTAEKNELGFELAHNSAQIPEGQNGPKESSSSEIILAFPEGGLRGWMTIFGASLVQYCTFGYTSSFGVYQDFYVRQFLTHYTPTDIGWIGGIQIFLVFSSGLFTGRAFDKGYFHYLMIASALFHAIGLFMLSLSHENKYYQVFLTQGICVGLSSGLAFVPSLSIVSHYFRQRRPLAIGFVSAGAALGATLHPIMLNKFFHGSLGFHNGVRVSAALNVTLLIIGNLLMRTRLPPKTSAASPQIKNFFSDPPYVVMIMVSIFIFSGLFFPIFYLQLYAVKQGVDQNIAFYSLAILNASSVFGRTVPNILVPQLGMFNLFIFSTAGAGIIILSMVAVTNTTGTILFALFYGFFSGATVSLSFSAIGSLAKDVSEIGARLGIILTFGGIMGLFASPIAGALLTDNFRWLNATLFAGITMIAAGGCETITRMYIARRKNSQWV